MTTSTTIQEVTQALADNYLGIGSTPALALASLTEDLASNRLHAEDFGATHDELLVAIGTLMLEIMDRWVA